MVSVVSVVSVVERVCIPLLHGNVEQFLRSRDILFAITRKKPSDCVYVLIVNSYTFGAADFYKIREEFPEATCVVFAGDWNAYTV